MKCGELMYKDILKKMGVYVLIIFLIIQPIFDLKIFYNSYSTLIRTVIITLFCFILFLKDKNKKKYYAFAYLVCLGIFFVFHNYNAVVFKSAAPDNFSYSWIKEIVYFIKMQVPLMLIYVLYNMNIKNERLKSIIKYITIIMGGTIIVTNLFCIAYGSYTDIKIEKNFLFWFTAESKTYTYKDLLSKGLFEYANQIGAVLVMFLPFNINLNLKDGKNKYVIIINLLSIVLLGTRVAVLGTIIVFLYLAFIRFFCFKYNKENNDSKKKYLFIIILIIAYIAFLPQNPVFNRIDEMANLEENTIEVVSQTTEVITEDISFENSIQSIPDNITNDVNQINDINEEKTEYNSKLLYIKNNYKDKRILEQFIFYSYPYQYYPDFWIDIMNKDIKLRTNYRYIEKEMVKHAVKYNNNFNDKLLGISYVRIQNIFNIEQDFVVHYYSIGLIGMLLIFLPYFIIIVKKIIELMLFVRTKQKVNEENIISIATILFLYIIAYNSGNLLNSLSFTIYFSIIYAILLNSNKKEEKNVC